MQSVSAAVLREGRARGGSSMASNNRSVVIVPPVEPSLLGPESTWPRPGGPTPGWAGKSGALDFEAASRNGAAKAGSSISVEEAVSRYCWYLDEHRADLMTSLLAENVAWKGSVEGVRTFESVKGRDAVMDVLEDLYWRRGPQRRHIATNVICERRGSTDATVWKNFLLTVARGGRINAQSTGVYRLDFRLEGDAWWVTKIFANFDVAPWEGEATDLTEHLRDLVSLEGN